MEIRVLKTPSTKEEIDQRVKEGKFFHREAAQGKWFGMSFDEQMGNIGSEVGRTAIWQGKDEGHFQYAVERALELFDLKLADARWKGRLLEIVRARELFCQAVAGENEYSTTLQDLDNYFLLFALAARAKVVQ